MWSCALQRNLSRCLVVGVIVMYYGALLKGVVYQRCLGVVVICNVLWYAVEGSGVLEMSWCCGYSNILWCAVEWKV